jgi:hypothetical protein
MRIIAAPVVPMKLAKKAPAAKKRVLVAGVASRSPDILIPPEITNRLKSSTMKGMYSSRIE